MAQRHHRFDIRRSPVDGKFRVWQTIFASQLGIVDMEDAQEDPDQDYPVQVVTGVFDTRKAVFAAHKR